MLTIEKVDTTSRKQVARFVNLPYRLYAHHPQWTPPLRQDIRRYLDREKFLFYDHSVADFFLAVRNGRDIGRIAVLEHRLFNQYHNTRQAQFYFFDCEEDAEAAAALFESTFYWAQSRHLNKIVGPKGFTVLDGFGILIEGFGQQQTMSFTNYNYAYYPTLIEALGFNKEVDFISCYLEPATFQLPVWLHRLAAQVQQKAALSVHTVANLRALLAVAPTLLQTYNQAFTANWEYYPAPNREIEFVINELKPIAAPQLFKIIKHEDKLVGFLFALPDLSSALQRAYGRLTPLSILDLLLAKRRLHAIVLVAVGILDPFRQQGGNALLMAEMEKTVRALGVQRAELINIADSAIQMRRDLAALNIKPHKVHRVYSKDCL